MVFEKLKNIFNKKNKSDNNSDLEDLFETKEDDKQPDEHPDNEQAQDQNQEQTQTENSDTPSSENPQPEAAEQEKPVNLNAEINELLREDAETDLVEVNYDYINDVSVYDTVRNEKSDVTNEEEETKIEKQTEAIPKIFIIIMCALLFMVLASAVALFVVININKHLLNPPVDENSPPPKKMYMAEQTDFTSNSSNYIYLKQVEYLGDKEIKLSRMIADPVATIFYFETDLDTQKYSFVLTDNNEKLYSMDLYFAENNSSDNLSSTVIRFEPLTPSAKSINLNIRENYPENPGDELKSADFKIGFNEKLQMSEVRYLKKPVEVKNDDFSAEITDVILSSSGTIVEYCINNIGNKNYKVIQSFKNNSTYLEFEEGSANLVAKKSIPEMYSFDNNEKMLGRMDFGHVRSLNGNYYITMTDLYKRYDVNENVLASSVSAGGENKTQTIDIDGYRFIFEGLASFNDRIALVFHAEDKNKVYDPKNPLDNRVEAIIDAQLVGTTDTGMEVILDGTCSAAQRGTDMIFPVDESARNFIYAVSRDNLRVNIKAFMIKMDDVKIHLNYNQFSENQNLSIETFNETVTTAFESRLKYKSQRGSFASIIGFEESVLEDSALMSNYEPIETQQKPNYGASVLCSRIDNDSAVAVVQDTWVGVKGSEEIQFYRKHKIKAQKTKLGWTITEDKIMQ